jgi:hypothetical protein
MLAGQERRRRRDPEPVEECPSSVRPANSASRLALRPTPERSHSIPTSASGRLLRFPSSMESHKKSLHLGKRVANKDVAGDQNSSATIQKKMHSNMLLMLTVAVA